MSKSRGFLPILVPSATVFISSACIMIIELVASRLIAKHLGSSLYTWTAVIGVVLAGITIGNYLGGRIADKFKARKTLAAIFVLSSAACVVVVILNNVVGEWVWLWKLNWPTRIFSHVALVFLGPSLLLGTISPVVAKMALDRGLSTGRTVGDIYACGAAGSIFGTFLAGFYLIPAIGTIAIVWSIGAVLLIMGILYWVRLWPAYIWAVVFLCALLMGTAPAEWAQKAGSSLSLRENNDPEVVYENETSYCYVAVKQISKVPDKRLFMQDKLKHSEILMDDRNNLQYFHTIIYAAITHSISGNKETLSVLHIGGGGYVFPQYIESHWPRSRNDVAEIDPGITRAAIEAFGLSKDTKINTIQMDARNYIDGLLQKGINKREVPKYDFIYEDAFSDYSIPYQLVTKEFNDKISEILTDRGIYMINSIDIYDSGLFIGNYLYTLEQTFPYVYIVAQEGPRSGRKIFVLIASKIELDIEKCIRQYKQEQYFWNLSEGELQILRNKANKKILTDDYVPVENLLAPVVNKSAKDFLVERIRKTAEEFKKENKFEEAILEYEKIIKIDPTISILAYNEIAFMRFAQSKFQEAADSLKKAIEYNKNADFHDNMANIYVSLGTILKQMNKTEESFQYYNLGINGYIEELERNPKSLKTIVRTGDVLATIGNFQKASVYFAKAVDLESTDLDLQMKLIQSLEMQGKYDEAIASTNKAMAVMQKHNKKEELQKLKQTIEMLEFKKVKMTGQK